MQSTEWDRPAAVSELWPAEHLLVWTLRAIACGHADCPAVRSALVGACGEAADQALNAIFVVIQYIGMIGRRRLALHPPGCAFLNADERALVAVVAAAQDSLGIGDGQCLIALLGELTLNEPKRGLVQALQLVAQILLDSGCRLPIREQGGEGLCMEAASAVATRH
jgi:hypothetical protein